MAIKLTTESGETLTLTDTTFVAFSDVESLFEGTAYIDPEVNEYNILFGIRPDEYFLDDDKHGSYVRILQAEWIDTDPPTSFHNYVLEMMNAESPDTVMDIAEGGDGTYRIWEALDSYSNGFEEAVNREINSEGLEFVFGNGFSFYNLFSFIVREIVREYLYKHELY